MNGIVFVAMTVMACMCIGAGLGLEGFVSQALLIYGGILCGVIAMLCLEDHEKEEN